MGVPCSRAASRIELIGAIGFPDGAQRRRDQRRHPVAGFVERAKRRHGERARAHHDQSHGHECRRNGRFGKTPLVLSPSPSYAEEGQYPDRAQDKRRWFGRLGPYPADRDIGAAVPVRRSGPDTIRADVCEGRLAIFINPHETAVRQHNLPGVGDRDLFARRKMRLVGIDGHLKCDTIAGDGVDIEHEFIIPPACQIGPSK